MARLFSCLLISQRFLFAVLQAMSKLQSRVSLIVLLLLLPFISNAGHVAQVQQLRSFTVPAQPSNFTLDFEEGNLRGWKAFGTAFQSQPTLNDNPTARNRGQPANQQGIYWIGTYENYQGRPGQRAGSIQGDGPQGVLASVPFTIPKGKMSFLVGGGSSFETRVELLVKLSNDPEFGNKMVYWASGRNTETMHRVTWDLTHYAGKTGTLKIIDGSSGGWGHINADDFRFPSPFVEMVPMPNVAVPVPIEVTVPQLVGWSRDQAIKLVEDRELSVGEIRGQLADQPPNTVIAQKPSAGTKVKVGTPVYLVVAIEDMATVPNLIGADENGAVGMLEEARLQRGRVVKRRSEEPPGTVFNQRPKAGSLVEAGFRVDMAVAVPVDITVPDVIELFQEEAEKRLDDTGLKTGQITKRPSPEQPGTVLDQKPAAGVVVKPGAAVDLLVAVPELVTVPNLVGMSRDEAIRLLYQQRLELGRMEDRPAAEQIGTIVAQQPAAGSQVLGGSSVDLVLAVEGLVIVPSVVGMYHQEALASLSAAGLASGIIKEQESDQPAGTVLGQQPSAGQRAARNTAVSLVIAGEKKALMPWYVYAGIIGGIIAAAGAASAVTASLRKGKGRGGNADGPRVEVRPHYDPGKQTIRPVGSKLVDFEIKIKAQHDKGTQSIQCHDALIDNTR